MRCLPLRKRRNASTPAVRRFLPTLPRVERVIACTPEQCICGNCGGETKVIGYEVSEVLDVEPARYFVQVTKREKKACKSCPEQVWPQRLFPRESSTRATNATAVV